MNSRLRGCTLFWAVKTCGEPRCEHSSFRKPSCVRHRIPCSPPQLSDIGSCFFSSCLNISNRPQTSGSMSWKMGPFIQQLLLHQQNTVSSPKPLPCCLPLLERASCFMSLSLRAHTSELTFLWWRWPELCLGLLEGDAESACGQRAASSGSVSGDQKLGGGVQARAAHET